MTRAFFVIGPAGSGKSRVAKELAKRVGGLYLDKDVVCNGFTGMLLESRGYDASERDGNDYYRDDLMPMEYRTLLGVGGDNLALGTPVIFDAPFGAYFADDGYVEQARAEFGWPEDAEPVVVHVKVDGDTVRARLIARGLSRDAWKLEHWDEFWAKASGATCAWTGATHVTVDNNADTESGASAADEVLAQLG